MALAGVIAREIVAARNWRNLPMVAPVTVLAIADLLMHLEAAGIAAASGLGWRLGLAAVIVLVSIVGGRIIPSFTHNWLAERPHARPPKTTKAVERTALGTLHTGIIGWAFVPDFRPVGILLLLGAATNLWRLARWRGAATRTEPLLLILHIGYTWLVLGAGLLGLSVLANLAQSPAIHALTAGAIGTMTLAVMTRATLGHTGHELTADRTTLAIFLLVTLAAAARVVAATSGNWVMPLLETSAILWICAFALFVLHYGPLLFRPRAVPGGSATRAV